MDVEVQCEKTSSSLRHPFPYLPTEDRPVDQNLQAMMSMVKPDHHNWKGTLVLNILCKLYLLLSNA